MAKKKQLEIAGTEPQSIPVIEEAAEEYRRLVTDRLALQKKEKPAKQNLVSVMKLHGRSSHTYFDSDNVERRIVITENTKASVRAVKANDEDDGDEEGNEN